MAREMMLDGYFHVLNAAPDGFRWSGIQGMPAVPTLDDALRYAMDHCASAQHWRLVFIENHADAEWTAALERSHAPRLLHEQIDACVSG
jgi:hypothetical protein